jgi:hypothetical protein
MAAVIFKYPKLSPETNTMMTEVEVFRPNVRHLINMDRYGNDESLSQIEVTVRVISELTGLTIKEIEALDAEDFRDLSTVVDGFFPPLETE